MAQKYNPHKIEAKWREIWPQERESFKLDPSKEPYYTLDMFSYPSSEGLHMGHWRPYTISDVWARYNTLLGKQVLSPVGFDSFGLPAENAAIKFNSHPNEFTQKAITNFTRQIKEMGKMYDWSTMIVTSSPEYYKWTQWIFTELFNNGLAYRKSALVNWCPKDQTVLANEQVEDGKCERCKTVVEKKELKQWFLKITNFADDLLNFDGLDWPDRVKTLQRNWIGKSEGAELTFTVDGVEKDIAVFTTRPDTLFGVTYLVVAPEYTDLPALTTTEHHAEVAAYVSAAAQKTDIERLSEEKGKTGVFTGSYAIHPITGDKVPIWVADYVLATYGTGAVMAVPAHDERDFVFAQNYDLPIKHVLEPMYLQSTEPGKIRDDEPFDERNAIIAIVKHWSEDKYMALKWKKVAWGTFVTGGIEEGQTAEEAAIMEIREETGFLHPKLVKELGKVHGKFYHVPKKTNRWAKAAILYFELQDDAREATAEVENDIHEILWLTKEELEAFLTPDTHQYGLRSLHGNSMYAGHGILKNSGNFDGQNSDEAIPQIVEAAGGKMKTSYRIHDWLVSRQRYWGAPIPIIYCAKCGEVAVPEKDLPILLPDDAEFLPDGGSPLERHASFKHATCPKCGGEATRETDTLDTFVDSSWYFMRYLSPQDTTQAFDKEQIKAWMPVDFYVGGTEHSILHLLYARFVMKALHKIGHVPYHEPFQTFYGNGMVFLNGAKMSKSKGNVINPDDIIKKYGTDAMRGYILFMGPSDQDVEWQENGITGVSRFLQKAWQVFQSVSGGGDTLHPAIEEAYSQVKTLLPGREFNRCISALMIAVNDIGDTQLNKTEAKVLAQLMAPFFPHFAEEVWQQIGESTSIFTSTWPNITVTAKTTTQYVVQVNGKLRGSFEVNVSDDEATVVLHAQEIVNNALEGKTVIKTVFVPGRIVNFVVQ